MLLLHFLSFFLFFPASLSHLHSSRKEMEGAPVFRTPCAAIRRHPSICGFGRWLWWYLKQIPDTGAFYPSVPKKQGQLLHNHHVNEQ